MAANICHQGEPHMPRSTDWTRNETLAAFHIYLQLPFGQLHRMRFKYVAFNCASNISNGWLMPPPSPFKTQGRCQAQQPRLSTQAAVRQK
jgi:hypothetical protein